LRPCGRELKAIAATETLDRGGRLWDHRAGFRLGRVGRASHHGRGSNETAYRSRLRRRGPGRINENLTKLGEQGWELVAVTPGIRGDKGKEVAGQTTYFFKRPK
jgi:hypothetical protein